MKYDCIIVGAGPAGVFCAYEFMEKKPDAKILLIDKGKNIYKRKCPVNEHILEKCPINREGISGCHPACSITNGFGGAGAFSDGKFNITTEFGGWLTALLMDDTLEGDKVNSKQKLKIAQMLIDLHKLKAESLDNPGLLINKDVNVDLKDLSIETIKNLIYNSEQLETKNNAINRLKERNDLTYEDIEYLKTLNTNTLLSFVNDLEKEDENNIKKEEKNDAKNN